MTVRIYRSTDASAPVLSGTAGALVGVLDACLVTGYGSNVAAGWAKSYSGTNKAAYRQPAGSNQFYLRVDDTGAQEVRLVGYEAMSGVDTGTGPFPTSAQQSGGLYAYKSLAASAAARPWVLVTNGKIFYLFTAVDGTTFSQGWAFGDPVSYKPGDAYHTIIIGGAVAGVNASQLASVVSQLSSAVTGHYQARAYTQVGSSITLGNHTDGVKYTGAVAGSGGMSYPTLPDGALWFAPLWLHEPSNSCLRGELPGLFVPLHIKPLSNGDTFTGSGAYAGKTFEAVMVNGGANQGQLFFETSDTW